MRDSFRILFESKQDREIYEESIKQVQNLVKGTEMLVEAIEDLCKGEFSESREVVNNVLSVVGESDKMAIQIQKKVIESIRDPYNREDLLRFANSIRNISHGVKAVAHRVDMCERFEVPELLRKDLCTLAKSVISTVKALERTISRMPFYPEEALEYAEEIHKYEEKVDDVRRGLMLDFVHVGAKMNIIDFYLMTEIIENLENIADRCEETGILIEFIVLSK